MSCLPKDQFDQHEYLNQLTCSIGLGIFNDPVELPCQHTFCRSCIKGWLKKGGTCPKCRMPTKTDNLKVHRVFTNMINNSIIACNHETCKWKGPFANLQLHIMTTCPEEPCYCPYGCKTQDRRCVIEQHMKTCELRIEECKYCHAKGQYKVISQHEGQCQMNEIDCPNQCGLQFSASLLKKHLEQDCPKRKLECKFKKYIECNFAGDSDALAEHYKNAQAEHLSKLSVRVLALKNKIEATYNLGAASASSPMVDIYWSNGLKKVSGQKNWAMILTKESISRPFKANLKIAELDATDTNGWKICLGVFTSTDVAPGSWGKYRNGWGYILGNGNKVFTESTSYGKPFGENDIITIEWSGSNLIFYKNSQSQGIAYTDIRGPLYIGTAISSSGHSVELLNVTLIDR